MPSLQLYLLKPLMRLMRRSQARFAVHDAEAFVRFRRRADRIADVWMRPPRGVPIAHTTVGGVPCDWLVPQGAPEDTVMLFLHGGGILFGWGSPHRRMVAYLAHFARLRTLGVAYRLAPEHRYPAAHDDCFAVYRAMVEQGRHVVLIGESSGGVLALATLLRAREAGLPPPPLCALISPTVDYGFEDVRIWETDDPFVPPTFPTAMHEHYIAGNDTRLPDLGPIYADLSGLPPLYVMTAEHDVLRCETERLVAAAEENGIETEVVYWPHVWHGWHVLLPQLPEATQAIKALGEAIRQRIGAFGLSQGDPPH
jgi:monoterpene epsilon-lactone hydrolase